MECTGSLKCALSHSYDRSRDGYYNLLLNSSGGVHGDNKEMLLSRRNFLNTGAYRPLANEISDICSRYSDKDSYILDAGCGEGYYTDMVEKSCGGATVYAFDISKDGAKLTAKKNKSLRVAVASSYDMPFSCEEFDVVFNVFSPMALTETHRVLKKGGKFIIALPGKKHLFGLKEKVYETPYENEPEDTYLDSFKLIEKKELLYEKEFFKKEEISALFMMTPYAYRTKKEEREKAFSLEYVKTEIEFIILVYEKIQ